MRDRKMTGRFLAAILAAAVAACAGEAPREEGEEPGAAEEAERAMRPGATEVTLRPSNESGVSGNATLRARNDSLQVMLQVSGVEPGQSYPAHIHQGDCAQGGGVAVGLNPVQATEQGARSATSVATAQLDPGGSYFIQVHGTGGAPIACGDVPPGFLGGGSS